MNENNNTDIKERERVDKIWKENLEISGRLAECYYDSILEEYGEPIEKSSKEDLGFNTFADGIRVGLDIIIPLLDENKKKETEERINFMIEKRERINHGKDMKKVNCSYCGKEIECPEDMLNVEKHICYECFKNSENKIKPGEIGKAHIDIPMDKVSEEMPDMLAESCTNNVFPDIWTEYKEEVKEFSKKELARTMFKLGAGIMADNLMNSDITKDKNKDKK